MSAENFRFVILETKIVNQKNNNLLACKSRSFITETFSFPRKIFSPSMVYPFSLICLNKTMFD